MYLMFLAFGAQLWLTIATPTHSPLPRPLRNVFAFSCLNIYIICTLYTVQTIGEPLKFRKTGLPTNQRPNAT